MTLPRIIVPIDIRLKQKTIEKIQKEGKGILTIELAGKKYSLDLTKFNEAHDPHSGQFAPGHGGATMAPDTGAQIGGGGAKPPAPKKPPKKPSAQPKQDSGSKFNPSDWKGGDARKRWAELPVNVRDDMADAGNSIAKRQQQLMAGMQGRPNSGKLDKDLEMRAQQFKDRVHPEATKKITSVVDSLGKDLKELGVEEGVRRQLLMDSMDALNCQEMEACTRQLGDHGIAHIEGNIRMGSDILKQVPGANTTKNQAMLKTAMIFHDTGYMTEPSQNFLDEGHPRWSGEHYDEHIRSTAEKAFGRREAKKITSMIETHAGTTLDWNDDPVGSATRLADNLALFHKEKVPPIMRYVDGNTQLIKDMAGGKINIDECHKSMKENVQNSNLPDKVKALLMKGVGEVNEDTPKYSLGMLGGEVGKMKWNGSGMDVRLLENKDNTELNKLGDFGQEQFGKFCKTYGIDPAQFKRNLNFELKGDDGKVVLRGIYSRKRKSFELEFFPDGVN